MSSPVYEYTTMIRESQLDTFGHVNNAVYMVLFEEARWDFITKNGYGLARVQELQIGPIVIAVEINYYKELRNREIIKITSTYKPLAGKFGLIEQTIIRADQQVACVAKFTFALFDMRQRKIIEPTAEFMAAVGAAPA